jgi:hypothetical protein
MYVAIFCGALAAMVVVNLLTVKFLVEHQPLVPDPAD